MRGWLPLLLAGGALLALALVFHPSQLALLAATLPAAAPPAPLAAFSSAPAAAGCAGGAAAAPPDGIHWVPIDALLDLNTSARALAPGCPPLPALCRMQDFFDEVMVISLPRVGGRVRRVHRQLTALGTPYTMVQARDKRTGDVTGLAHLMVADHGNPGVLSLYMTHLAMLQYILKSPFRNFVFFEDDVTFAADFPAAFDAAARALPPDWVGAWLGWISQFREGVPLPAPGALWAAPKWGLAQACALGLSREAAQILYDGLIEHKMIIDQAPFRALIAAHPSRVHVASPPVAAANPYTDSTMGHNWPHPGADYRAANDVQRARFDLFGGGYAPGAAYAGAQCAAVERGFDYFGGDVVEGGFSDTRTARPLALASAEACCQACMDDWPRCRFWTHIAGDGLCYLKYNRLGRRPAREDFTSGSVTNGFGA